MWINRRLVNCNVRYGGPVEDRRCDQVLNGRTYCTPCRQRHLNMELQCEDDLQDETEVGKLTEHNMPRYHVCAVWTPFGFDLGFRGEKFGV